MGHAFHQLYYHFAWATHARDGGTAGAARTMGKRGTEFIGREFAIAVFVELLQGLSRLGNFGGVDDTIVIGIQHGDDRRWKRTMELSAGAALGAAARTTTRTAIAGRGEFPAWAGSTGVLSCGGPG